MYILLSGCMPFAGSDSELKEEQQVCDAWGEVSLTMILSQLCVGCLSCAKTRSNIRSYASCLACTTWRMRKEAT